MVLYHTSMSLHLLGSSSVTAVYFRIVLIRLYWVTWDQIKTMYPKWVFNVLINCLLQVASAGTTHILGKRIDQYSTDIQPTLHWHSTDNQSALNWLSANTSAIYQSTVGGYLADVLTECRSIYRLIVWTGIAYIKHDPSVVEQQSHLLQLYMLCLVTSWATIVYLLAKTLNLKASLLHLQQKCKFPYLTIYFETYS